MENKIPAIIVDEDNGETPEVITVWGLDNIESWAQYLRDNIDDKTEMKVTFVEMTQEQWDMSIIRGKYFGGEQLTTEEQTKLDAELN